MTRTVTPSEFVGHAPYLIVLRGVTPTGRNKVPMAALRTALGKAGLAEVRTHIQSGNVIARSPLGRGLLEALVHEVIASEIGAEIQVMARTREELGRLIPGHTRDRYLDWK